MSTPDTTPSIVLAPGAGLDGREATDETPDTATKTEYRVIVEGVTSGRFWREASMVYADSDEAAIKSERSRFARVGVIPDTTWHPRITRVVLESREITPWGTVFEAGFTEDERAEGTVI